MRTPKLFLTLGAASAGLAVAAGAFGAHGLKTVLPSDLLAIFDTASRYQMTHALGLIAAAWVADRWPGRWAEAAGWLLLAGSLVFCGSLYALSLSGIRAFGAIAPVGGLAFIAGWTCLAVAGGRTTQ